MLKGLRASTLTGAFEIYTVTERAQIALAYCTSSWALCLHQRSPFLSSIRSPFPAFRFASLQEHKTQSCSLKMRISDPAAASQTQNSEPCSVLWTTQPLTPPPQSCENDFSHSISSASITTAWHHGEVAASRIRWKAD